VKLVAAEGDRRIRASGARLSARKEIEDSVSYTHHPWCSSLERHRLLFSPWNTQTLTTLTYRP
jgi:hypothetical protein